MTSPPYDPRDPDIYEVYSPDARDYQRRGGWWTNLLAGLRTCVRRLRDLVKPSGD